MTTAHKPTFHPAVGSQHMGGFRFIAPRQQVAVRDLNAHTTLKFREPAKSIDSDAVLARERQRNALLERERAHAEQKQRGQRREGLLAPTEASEPPERVNDADEVLENGARSGSDSESEHDNASGSDSDDDDDDDDDEAELMKELARIKKEREEDRRRQEAEKAVKDAQARNEAIMRGNPLLDMETAAALAAGSAAPIGVATVKRRWDDDLIFRNQARDEPEVKKRFINDAIRSDFHKKFLSKYMK